MKFPVFPALITALLFTLTACGQDYDNITDDEGDAVREVIKIGRLMCGGHLSLAIVERKFQQDIKSFRLTTVQNQDWNAATTAMLEGELAGTFILSPLAMNLIRDGFPGKIVLMADRNGIGFILSNAIQSIDALKTRKTILAVPHIFSQHHVLLHTILQQHAVPKANVTIVRMRPREMTNSLRNGEIDGFIAGEPKGNNAVLTGAGWRAAASSEIWQDHMDHVFLASNWLIEERPEQLQELIDQLVRSGEFIEDNPAEAAVIGEDYTGSVAAVFEPVLTKPANWITYTNMVAEERDIQGMAQKLVDMKLWNTVPANISTDYFDMSFAQKAQNNARGN